MDGTEPTAGQTIAERYRLIAQLGSGGMGQVWRAVRLPDQHECALKLLLRAPAAQMPERIARFLREARAAAAIDSPHAVRVLDCGVATETPFIAMELLEGETLDARLRREGPLAPAETARVISQIASALDRAHALGIVHRDLKPANVFLARHASGAVAKVLDFGVAKLCDDDTLAPELTASGALLGTPYYMSPEQIEGARYVDHATDLWSLGVIAFECMTGRRAFQIEGLRALFAAICVQPLPVPSALGAVPAGFDAWFARAAERDPRRRFRSAGELARALCDACAAELAWQETLDETGERPRPGERGRTSAAERGRPRRRAQAWGWSALAVVAAFAVWISLRWLAPPAAKIEAADTTLEPGAAVSSVPAAARGSVPTSDPRPRGVVAQTKSAAPEAPLAPAPARAKLAAPPRVLLDQRAPAGKRRSWDIETLLRDRK